MSSLLKHDIKDNRVLLAASESSRRRTSDSGDHSHPVGACHVRVTPVHRGVRVAIRRSSPARRAAAHSVGRGGANGTSPEAKASLISLITQVAVPTCKDGE